MSPRVTVCGLGPGGVDQVTVETREAMASATHCLLRTARHPSATLAPDHAESFDHLYEAADTFDEVYAAVVEEVVARAADGPTTYVVPGSPLVLERTVRWLRADDRVEVELLPALSFLDVAWARLGIDPVEESVRLLDGHRFAEAAADASGAVLIAHTHADWVLSDVKLAVDAGPETRAVILQALGTPDERIVEVGWPDLDRTLPADHLTSVYVPRLGATVGSEMVAAVDLMHRLRQDCPWDREQTHRSLRRYLVEETYEVVEVLDGLDDDLDGADPRYGDLEEELGDLLFQVLFHAELATEAGAFGLADVARTLRTKLTSRHPHVFGDVEAADAAEVAANWERIKKAEKGRTSTLDGIPPGLPGLSLAEKTLRRLDRAGAPLPEGSPIDDLGRRLLALTLDAHRAGVDPEQALRETVTELSDRYRRLEAAGTEVDADWAGPLWD